MAHRVSRIVETFLADLASSGVLASELLVNRLWWDIPPWLTAAPAYVTGFGKIGLNAANNFFQYPRVKPYWLIFFEKIIMAEMDRNQLALAYDAVVSSGVL